MTDISNPFAALGMSGLLQNDSKSMPQSMRQKIALAMMLKKQAYPKTFGEGLASAGDSIMDAITMRQMQREAADTEKTNKAVETGILGPPGGATPSPAAAGPSPVQAASIASGEPGTTMTPPAAPAVPAPPDVPGAVRMSTPAQLADFRGQNPLPTFRPPQGTVGRAPVGDEAGPPPQAMPSPLPPPGAPPPGLPPQVPQRPSVADFGQKPALAPTPPPGAPVMARGPDPASLPMAPPDDPRNAVALAMMRQGQTGQPQSPTFAGASQPPPISPPAAPRPVAQPDALAAAPPTPVIKQAPQDPTTQIQKAPTYAPDYVPQMRPERAPPSTQTLLMGKINDAIRNAAPGDREDLVARFKVPYETEQAKVKQAHDIYQSQLIEDRAHNAQVEQLRATAAQRAATHAHTVQQTNAGKIIQMEGRAFRVQDDGSLKDITPGQTGEGPPQIKMTQDQSDTLKFYKMGKTAASQLEGKEKILAEGWASELAGKVPFVGNRWMSSQYRAAKNAAGLLVQADLRDTSGATIGTQEYKDRFALLMPLSGDDALAMKNKAEARNAVLEGQRLALGPARPMADYVDKEHAKTRAEKAVTLNREMEGKDRSKTYEKNGVFRQWVGDHWEEH